MVGKTQKSHGARSGLYGGCSDGVQPIHFFQAEHKLYYPAPWNYFSLVTIPVVFSFW
jgi:hypothetical protein